jgi:hypothetical protein
MKESMMNMRSLTGGFLVLATLAVAQQSLNAQTNNTRNLRAYNSSRYTSSRNLRIQTGQDMISLAKRPTVSPYLNLLLPSAQRTGIPLYQSVVRPQLEQRRANTQQRVAIGQLQQQFTGLRAQAGGQQTATGIRSTGHTTRFMNFSHYYPGAR